VSSPTTKARPVDTTDCGLGSVGQQLLGRLVRCESYLRLPFARRVVTRALSERRPTSRLRSFPATLRRAHAARPPVSASSLDNDLSLPANGLAVRLAAAIVFLQRSFALRDAEVIVTVMELKEWQTGRDALSGRVVAVTFSVLLSAVGIAMRSMLLHHMLVVAALLMPVAGFICVRVFYDAGTFRTLPVDSRREHGRLSIPVM
jgi:hypothetical protein